MTLILDNLKRCEGLTLEDGTAPSTTLTSPHIIADSHYTFPILSGIYKNGRALAKVWSNAKKSKTAHLLSCLLYTSPSPRDRTRSRMPSSA